MGVLRNRAVPLHQTAGVRASEETTKSADIQPAFPHKYGRAAGRPE